LTALGNGKGNIPVGTKDKTCPKVSIIILNWNGLEDTIKNK